LTPNSFGVVMASPFEHAWRLLKEQGLPFENNFDDDAPGPNPLDAVLQLARRKEPQMANLEALPEDAEFPQQTNALPAPVQQTLPPHLTAGLSEYNRLGDLQE